MSEDELKRRQELSFLQAEGLEELPTLCSGTEVTSRFRALVFDILMDALGYKPSRSGGFYPTEKSKFVWTAYFCKYSDEIPYFRDDFNKFIKSHISSGAKLLDLILFCVRTTLISEDQYRLIEILLRKEMIGYRFVGEYGEQTVALMPIHDEAEGDANRVDYASIRDFPKSQEHFRQAIEEINSGHFRGSVAESISGVESIVKSLTGKASVTLGDGLKLLAKDGALSPALKAGLDKLYGWTNSPSGMRHALSDESKDVTEAEARFMLSACLAFAAWLKRSFVENKPSVD